MTFQWVSFTSDYGTADAYVAVCKGVLAGIAPDARVVDVTHAVPAQDVRRGAAVLAQTVGYLPPAVHLAVVDPGVGTARRGIAVEAGPAVLVGPDNGLLLDAAAVLGGVRRVHELTEPRYRLPQVSATFHGRDVFAPAAGHLAAGVPITALGPALDPSALVRLPAPEVTVRPGYLRSDVLTVDTFGNLQLAATAVDLRDFAAHLGDPVTVTVGSASFPATLTRTFADVPPGDLTVHLDSTGHVSIARNTASATTRLGGPDTVTITRTP
jgi:S-adenosyl-L-methionine hydrolase (adenosine-forming)